MFSNDPLNFHKYFAGFYTFTLNIHWYPFGNFRITSLIFIHYLFSLVNPKIWFAQTSTRIPKIFHSQYPKISSKNVVLSPCFICGFRWIFFSNLWLICIQNSNIPLNSIQKHSEGSRTTENDPIRSQSSSRLFCIFIHNFYEKWNDESARQNTRESFCAVLSLLQ